MAFAKERIALVDLGLYDLSRLPATKADLDVVASLTPTVKERLTGEFGHEVLDVHLDETHKNWLRSGYLLDHPTETMKLGKTVDADWIAVGRLNKITNIVSFLEIQLIDLRANRMVAAFSVGIKGDSFDPKNATGGARVLAKLLAEEVSAARKAAAIPTANATAD